jgi:hypothetical protein
MSMKRTAQILKFKELKTMADVSEANNAIRSDFLNRRVTFEEHRQISDDLISLLKTMNTINKAKLATVSKKIQDLLSTHSPARE